MQSVHGNIPKNFNILLLICHCTLNLGIRQESKQHFNLTGLYFKKRFSFIEHWQLKIGEKNKREESWQPSFFEKVANKIHLGNENSAIGGNICNELFFHF